MRTLRPPVPGFALDRARRHAIALVTALALAGGVARAADTRLESRLDPETLTQVTSIVEGAEQSRLPTEPLIATALEGASKRAPGARIVAAVRRHAAALAGARQALGSQSTEAELVAGAGAMLAGVPGDTLVRLRAARPRQSVVIPLVVLSDMLARSVPPGAASDAVLTTTRAGARDADLLKLRERVEDDIRAGASPAEAAALRARMLTGAAGGPRIPGGPRPGRNRTEGSSP